MNIIFVDPSEDEFDDAIRYYKRIQVKLANRFYAAVMNMLDVASFSPHCWPLISKHTHKIVMKVFPYFILYRVEDDTLFVTSIGNQQKDPDFYKLRF